MHFNSNYSKIPIRKLLLFVVIIFFSFHVTNIWAQISVSGRITDTIGNPLPSVTISMIKADGFVLSFSISDSSGKYRIHSKEVWGRDSIFLKLSSIGFTDQVEPITKNEQAVNFKLIRNINFLPSITVKTGPPLLKAKKDTLEYDVSGFANQQDRVIGDVIKKLPGIEVGADGRILYQGKPISALYIDGDDLLSGNYNVATNNIPVDFVSKIQVLENHQDIKVLKKIDFNSQSAINIVLSNKAKLRLSGIGDVTIGYPNLIDINIQPQLFKKKLKFINLLKLNNSGNDLKSDISSHNRNELAQSIVGPLLSLPSANPPLDDKRDLFNKSGLIDINGLYKLNSVSQISINAYYLNNTSDQTSEIKRIAYLPSDTIKYLEFKNTISKESPFLTKITLTANHTAFYLKNAIQFEVTPNMISSALVVVPGGKLSQVLDRHSTSFSNDFRIIGKLGKKMAVEGRSYISTNTNPVNLNAQPSLVQDNLTSGSPALGLLQLANTPSTYTENYISASIPGKIVQSYKMGFVYDQSALNSQLQNIEQNSQTSPIADSLENKTVWKSQKIYFQPKFAFHSDRAQADIALNIQQQKINYGETIANTEIERVQFLPSLNAKLLTGKESNILLNSFTTNDFGNILNVFQNDVLMDYRTLSKNSGLLPKREIFTNSLSYNYRKTLNLLFASIGLLYSVQKNNSIMDYHFTSTSIETNNLPYENRIHNFIVFGNISQYIFPLSTTVSINYSTNWATTNQYQNGELIEYQNTINQMRCQINSKISNKMNFSYDGTFNFSQNKPTTSNTGTSQNVSSLLQKMEVNYNANAFTGFKLGGEQYYTKTPTSSSNNIFFIDAGWFYRSKNGNNDFRVTLNNILDARRYQQITLNSNIVDERSFEIRPKTITLKYSFRF